MLQQTPPLHLLPPLDNLSWATVTPCGRGQEHQLARPGRGARPHHLPTAGALCHGEGRCQGVRLRAGELSAGGLHLHGGPVHQRRHPICRHTCIQILHTCVRTYIHASMHAYLHTYVNVDIYIYIYIHTHRNTDKDTDTDSDRPTCVHASLCRLSSFGISGFKLQVPKHPTSKAKAPKP